MVSDSSLVCTPLVDEQLNVVVSPTHPLTNEKTMNITALSQYPCLLPGRGFFIRDYMERTFAKHELPLLVSHELFALDAIKELVKT
ncbi:MAG: substrate-binding domain-containing protein [Legionella sp.]